MVLVFEPGLAFVLSFVGCLLAGVVPVPVYVTAPPLLLLYYARLVTTTTPTTATTATPPH